MLQQPIENIYLVSTSAMDPIISLGALDSIALSGTKADAGTCRSQSRHAGGADCLCGKYSAPDYETILASGCGLAIENTMIYHTPEVKEQLEKFGIPVLVERSSYETDPLARMEWVKLYGILLGKQQEAEQLFDTQVQRVAPLENQQPTGKTVAFFSITSNNLVTVRKGSDYVARMIEMAGGSYVFADLTDSGNNLATINLSLEDFTPVPRTPMCCSTTAPLRAALPAPNSWWKNARCWRSSRPCRTAMCGVPRRACSSKAWSFRI